MMGSGASLKSVSDRGLSLSNIRIWLNQLSSLGAGNTSVCLVRKRFYWQLYWYIFSRCSLKDTNWEIKPAVWFTPSTKPATTAGGRRQSWRRHSTELLCFYDKKRLHKTFNYYFPWVFCICLLLFNNGLISKIICIWSRVFCLIESHHANYNDPWEQV